MLQICVGIMTYDRGRTDLPAQAERVDIGVLGPGTPYINPPTPGHGPIVCHNAYAYLKHMIVCI